MPSQPKTFSVYEESLTETNVAGRKIMVTTAMALIDDASLADCSDIFNWIMLSLCAAALKAW